MNRRQFLGVLLGLSASPYATMPHELGGTPRRVEFRAVKLRPRIVLDPEMREGELLPYQKEALLRILAAARLKYVATIQRQIEWDRAAMAFLRAKQGEDRS